MNYIVWYTIKDLLQRTKEMKMDKASENSNLQETDASYFPDKQRLKHIEASLRTKYKHKIFNKFVQAICDFDLVRPDDKIAVCISGGKDSMLMAKLFQELKRRNKIPFEVKFLSMDPG